uniref:Proteasome assembly chaperone 1 n=1 Tax=Stomoxys calcitrans TaxID=35570 RepID=A0A1I8QB62_STOCA
MGCPMGFGELNIPSSRAFWDDCDEDECPKTEAEKLQLKYESCPDGADWKNCKLMFVLEGPNIADFGQGTLLMNDSIKIATIPSKKSTLHFSPKKQMLIAIIDEDLNTSGEICDLLLALCKPQEVITLTIKPKVDYKSENIAAVREEITFLRSIEGELKDIAPLEAPNFIAGVAAGVCSWRSNENLKNQTYIAYTDNIALDPLAAKPIWKLLNDLNIECCSSYKPKKRDDSHLYM